MTTTELAIFKVTNVDAPIVVDIDKKMLIDLEASVEKCKWLEIKWIDDKEGYNKVHEARMELRNLRVKVQKDAKLARDWHTKYNKAIIEAEDTIIGKITPTEEELAKMEEVVDNEKKRIKEEKEKQEQIKMQERFEKLQAVGVYSVNLIELGKMADSMFEEILKSATEAFEKKQEEERIEQERIKKEQEDAAEAALEEQKKRDAEMEELRKKNEEEQKKRDAEMEELRKKNEALEAEKKAKDAEIEKAKREQELKDAAQRAKEETEARIRKEQEEERIHKEQETARLYKQKKMQEFLTKNGYSDETSHLFHIVTLPWKTVLFKKVDELTI